MSVAASSKRDPYVGPRPFTERDPLYGREREVRRLLGLLIAERVVLLHSPSGAGKTSLIQAGLVPALRKERFQLLPVVRVSREPNSEDRPAAAGTNRYLLSALLSLEEGLPQRECRSVAELARLDLASYLDRRSPAEGRVGAGASAGPGESLEPEVLIFDQFEEILTLDPTDETEKRAFFAQVAAAVRESNPNAADDEFSPAGDRARERWALFSIREDYLGALEPYVRLLPTRLSTRMRLDLLERDAALQAIRRPADEAGVPFTDDAAKRLVDELSLVRVQRNDQIVDESGSYVEPVHLQLVCRNLWAKRAPGATEIGAADIEQIGDVSESLAAYYADTVATAARKTEVPERAIRDWFGSQLITARGIRGQVLWEPGRSAGLDDQVITELAQAYLIRAEQRRGATWYELAHDRLIEAVRLDNERFQKTLNPWQLQAALWESKGRPQDLLLRAEEVDEAETWAQQQRASLTPAEHDFLTQSIEARSAQRREKRLLRQMQRLFIMLIAVTVLLFAIGCLAAVEQARARQASDRANHSIMRATADRKRAGIELTRAQAASARAQQDVALAWRIARSQSLLSHERAFRARQALLKARAEKTRADIATRQAGQAVSNAAIANGEAADARNQALVMEKEARRQYQVALAQRLSARALLLQIQRPDLHDLSVLLAIEAVQRNPNPSPEADQALRNGLALLPRPVERFSEAADVESLDYSPDGKYLAWASGNIVRVQTLAHARPPRPFKHAAKVTAIAFSLDEERLGTACEDGTAHVWETSTGRELPTPAPKPSAKILAVAFREGHLVLVAACQDGIVRSWNAETGQTTGQQLSVEGHGFLVLSPDGTLLATQNTAGGRGLPFSWTQIDIWNLATGSIESSHLFGSDVHFYSAAFSPSGDTLIGIGSSIHVLETKTGAVLQELNIAGIPVTPRVAVSPNGEELATIEGPVARIWNVDSRHEVARLNADGNIRAVAFSPKGRFVATASGRKMRTWEVSPLPPGEKLFIGGAHAPAAFSSTWKYLTSFTDGRVQIRRMAQSHGHPQVFNVHSTSAVALSPDERHLAIATRGRSGVVGAALRLYRLPLSQQPERSIPTGGPVEALEYSPDGKLLAAGSDDGTVRVLKVATGQEFACFLHNMPVLLHIKPILTVLFGPGGKYLATARGDTVCLWELASRRQIGHAITPGSIVWGMAFSPDGRRLATAGNDKQVRLWSAPSTNEIKPPIEHPEPVHAVAFSPDGRYLAGASGNAAHLWDLRGATGRAQEIATLVSDDPNDEVDGVTFSPDGKRLATQYADYPDRYVKLWQLEEPIAEARRRLTRALTPAERRIYVGAEPLTGATRRRRPVPPVPRK